MKQAAIFAAAAALGLGLVGAEALAQSPESLAILPRAGEGMVAYQRLRYGLYLGGTAWHWLGWVVLIGASIGLRVDRRVCAFLKQRPSRAMAVYAAATFAITVWDLPVGVFSYRLEKALGFATLGPALLAADIVRGWLLGLVYAPIAGLAVWMIGRSPRTWWVGLSFSLVPVGLAATVAYPLVIEPAYNSFRPLPASALRDDLARLAARAGVPNASILVSDVSRRTNRLNAYVSGLGPTTRIVIWDTALRGMSRPQLVAIIGHELGHYVMRHIWIGYLLGCGGAFVVLGIVAFGLRTAVHRFGPRMLLHGEGDPASVPLGLFLLSLVMFAQTPIEAAISRTMERQADRYGLAITRLPRATAEAYATFFRANGADPDPPRWMVLWSFSHPPLRERVDAALRYGRNSERVAPRDTR